ncbi:hypothetical protein Tco_0231112 [Tanacetum coccineum]
MLCLFIGAGCYIAAIKHMASNFAKLDKFEGVDFRRWQKKMHFLLFSMSVVYVLTDPILEDGGDDATVEQIRKRAKWDNDDYVCRGLILNGMSDSLFDIYQNVEYYKELWDSLQDKYMAKDGSSKKFLVSNFTNYKMIDSRPVMEQYNELLGILGRFTQHKINMDEAIQDEALDKFKVFKTEVELKQGSQIKRFRTDRGVVPEEVTEDVVQQPEPELRKSKRNRTPKDFGPEFQLYLIEGIRDEVSDQ